MLFQLVSARYERGSLILTSNKAFRKWGSVFGSDLQGYPEPTQGGQALQTLGIHHIVADSPQARGRIGRP